MNKDHVPGGFFEPTIWSTILKAQGGDEQTRQAAMERLLTRYRTPILRHIQAGLSGDHRTPEHAEDLTQEFICQALRLDFLKKVSPEYGRFRTFIRKCVNNFLRDQHARAATRSPRDGRAPLSLDQTDDDGNRLLDPPGPALLPGDVLDKEWALNILQNALAALKQECLEAHRGELFEALQSHLGRAAASGPASEIAARLGTTEGAIYTAMNRLRSRLGELIREEVRQTVGAEEDWREEVKYLIELLA